MPPAGGQVRGEGHDGVKERIAPPPDLRTPWGLEGRVLPSTASELEPGCHGCAMYGPSGRGAGVSTVGMLALGPLLGVGEKGTDMAGTRGSDHALEAC